MKRTFRSQIPPKPNGIRVNVTATFDMKEMENWPPQKITAFLSGLAELINVANPPAAKGVKA